MVAIGQMRFNANQLDTMVKIHQNHCDFTSKKFRNNFELGEVKMKIQFLDCMKSKDSLLLAGKVIANSLEGIPCNIFIASITDTNCLIEPIFAQTDNQGNFKIKIKRDNSKSIYFTSLSYLDLELRIKNLE